MTVVIDANCMKCPTTTISKQSWTSTCKANWSWRHQGSVEPGPAQQASTLPRVTDRWVPMTVVAIMAVSGTVAPDK
uniref:Uncharacterized protein n=1 Tax=Oryza sativa subsp. japonica TaxID=39947 RepID=Q7F242_ORYSJ|nr:hypothetical protein [Oryza sativa Japonica Group]BAC83020.1 hypothetical protein [Oryza sativa Japonica Group]